MKIYNTLTRKKEDFVPIHEGQVNMYACGITVSGEAHIGHAYQALIYDIIRKYFEKIGYKVNYARNYTDVDDKIIAKSKETGIPPLEYASMMIDKIDKLMRKFEVDDPTIWLKATCNIDNIIDFVSKLIEKGHAYATDRGDVYFSVESFPGYGKLSGRRLEDAYESVRIENEENKRNPLDFALWKSAKEGEIYWESPWGKGRPGWHIECSAMNRAAFGDQIDVHGGGRDLIFPHHECEIAQSVASQGDDMVHYWMHNNMITINGTKMGKSLGNFITLDEFFNGIHKLLAQAYTPMTIRFFILQAHYRSTVDFSNEALQASEKGLQRLMEAIDALDKITPAPATSEGINVKELRAKCYEAMNDDLNTPIVIAQLFEGARIINNVIAGNATISAEDLKELKETFHLFCFDIMGLKEEKGSSDSRENAYGKVVDMLLEQRMKAKANKDWATSDEIRNTLTALGFEVKDTKDGFEWRLNK